MNIGVVGGGSWGTALAKLLADKGYNVELWCFEKSVADAVNQEHENTTYLAGFKLPGNLSATDDCTKCVAGKDLILTVPPSHCLRSVLGDIKNDLPKGVPIVSASKGIENGTLMLMSDVLEDVLPIEHHPYLAYLSGPSFAKETAEHKPTAVTVASYNHKIAEAVQHIFSTDYFRVYTTYDVVGVEVGGALKNVIAIASGAISAMELGHNSTAGMITRGLAEMTRIATRLGANPLTLSGLSGMGDLVLTCTGGLSRNRTLGFKLGSGKKLQEIIDETNTVAEGIKTSKSVYDLSKKLGVEMPISDQVYQVIHEDKDARQAVKDIMSRDLKREMLSFS